MKTAVLPLRRVAALVVSGLILSSGGLPAYAVENVESGKFECPEGTVCLVGAKTLDSSGGSSGFNFFQRSEGITYGNEQIGGGGVGSILSTTSGGLNAATGGICAGNPVMVASGNKVEFETDFALPGVFGLSLDRTYNRNTNYVGMFGPKWITGLDRRLLVEPLNVLALSRADGSIHRFKLSAPNVWHYAGENGLPVNATRTVTFTGGRYVYTDASGNTETYSTAGSLLEHRLRSGVAWTFIYNNPDYVEGLEVVNPTLQSVTHSNGRRLSFNWSLQGGRYVVDRVTDSAGSSVVYSYVNGYLSGVTHPATPRQASGNPSYASDITTYHYDSAGQFLGKSFNGQRYSTFSYDSQGRALSSEHAGGVERYTFAYPSAGTTQVTNPAGRVSVHAFDSLARPVQINALGTNTCPAAFTQFAQPAPATGTNPPLTYTTTITRPAGDVLQSTVDKEGYVIQEVLNPGTALAQTTNYTWSGSPRRLTRIDRPLSFSVMTYDAWGRETSRTDTPTVASGGITGRTTTTSYSNYANGLPQSTTVDGPVPGTADAVTTNYNAAGDLVSIQTAAGTTTFSNHDALGNPRTVVDPNGAMTTLAYDARGRLVMQSVAGLTQRWAYDVLGQVTQASLPSGVVVNTRFDAALRPVGWTQAETYPAAVEGRTMADVIGTVESLSLSSQVTQRNWQRTTGPNEAPCGGANQTMCPKQSDSGHGNGGNGGGGNGWGAGGSNAGDPQALLGPAVTTSTFLTQRMAYDDEGRLRQLLGQSNQQQTWNRDSDGLVLNRQTVSELGTLTEAYEYDALRRLKTVTSALNGKTQFAYDAHNQLTQVIDPRGSATTYSRNGLGQVVQITSPDTGATSFGYTADGRTATEARADGTALSYGYQGDGRLQNVTSNRGGAALTRSYTWDGCANGKGRLCSVSESNGEALSYTYTAWGALATQTATIAGQSFTTRWDYDTAGQLRTLTYPSGLALTYTWADGRVREVALKATTGNSRYVVAGALYQPYGPLATFVDAANQTRYFTRDIDGRPYGITTAGGGLATFNYNVRDLITSVPAASLTNLTYDAEGHLTTATDVYQAATFSFDANGNRKSSSYSSGGSATYNMAAAGNRLSSLSSSSGNRYFVHDAAGNLLQDQRGGVTDCHGYDAFMRHAAFTRYSGTQNCGAPTGSATSSANYRFNGLNQRSFKNVGGVSTRYVYGPGGEMLYEVDSSGKQRHYIWLEGQVVALNTNAASPAATYAVYSDHLSRPYAVVDGAGTWQWSAQLQAFDRTVTLDNLGGLNLGFAGQYYDAESNLWQNWHRTYDATIGRYTQSDPIGLLGGINTYAYVGGNPLSLIDPDGLCPCGSAVDAIQLARGDKRDWSKAADRTDVNSGFGKGTYKCNLFADETLENAGYKLPNIGGGAVARAFGKYPPGAQSLSNPNYSVPGWPVVSGPAQAGDLVASAGHVGIATSATKTISASPIGVVENGWGFRSGQTSVIRRCTCQ